MTTVADVGTGNLLVKTTSIYCQALLLRMQNYGIGERRESLFLMRREESYFFDMQGATTEPSSAAVSAE